MRNSGEVSYSMAIYENDDAFELPLIENGWTYGHAHFNNVVFETAKLWDGDERNSTIIYEKMMEDVRFIKFMQLFRKTYRNIWEYNTRRAYFNRNFGAIIRHNERFKRGLEIK